MYRSHDATVRHDKVYALLGLCADDPKASALEPTMASLGVMPSRRALLTSLEGSARCKHGLTRI
ncbi:hypothetical protein F9C07_8042 [Aspergillus flavus]|uniref:Uncharacterized protein n=1 Tax=Aspergillus flavus (strain ATCC 200026 / FGSC A1120 / IAM 13836 / NRRL 3357 / JCM 12722 / SRRC 167) TaxID=332952 RepID=A0A7U2N208_ASPFN|nr:hypothetical protein F9C07_8042 [Aspergillus flavus]